MDAKSTTIVDENWGIPFCGVKQVPGVLTQLTRAFARQGTTSAWESKSIFSFVENSTFSSAV